MRDAFGRGVAPCSNLPDTRGHEDSKARSRPAPWRRCAAQGVTRRPPRARPDPRGMGRLGARPLARLDALAVTLQPPCRGEVRVNGETFRTTSAPMCKCALIGIVLAPPCHLRMGNRRSARRSLLGTSPPPETGFVRAIATPSFVSSPPSGAGERGGRSMLMAHLYIPSGNVRAHRASCS